MIAPELMKTLNRLASTPVDREAEILHLARKIVAADKRVQRAADLARRYPPTGSWSDEGQAGGDPGLQLLPSGLPKNGRRRPLEKQSAGELNETWLEQFDHASRHPDSKFLARKTPMHLGGANLTPAQQQLDQLMRDNGPASLAGRTKTEEGWGNLEDVGLAQMFDGDVWHVETVATGNPPGRPRRSTKAPSAIVRQRFEAALEQERRHAWRCGEVIRDRELIKRAVRATTIPAYILAQMLGVTDRTIRNWRTPTIPQGDPVKTETPTVLERIDAMQTTLDAIMLTVAESAQRLRDRFPTDAEVGDAVDRFLDQAHSAAPSDHKFSHPRSG